MQDSTVVYIKEEKSSEVRMRNCICDICGKTIYLQQFKFRIAEAYFEKIYHFSCYCEWLSNQF